MQRPKTHSFIGSWERPCFNTHPYATPLCLFWAWPDAFLDIGSAVLRPAAQIPGRVFAAPQSFQGLPLQPYMLHGNEEEKPFLQIRRERTLALLDPLRFQHHTRSSKSWVAPML